MRELFQSRRERENRRNTFVAVSAAESRERESQSSYHSGSGVNSAPITPPRQHQRQKRSSRPPVTHITRQQQQQHQSSSASGGSVGSRSRRSRSKSKRRHSYHSSHSHHQHHHPPSPYSSSHHQQPHHSAYHPHYQPYDPQQQQQQQQQHYYYHQQQQPRTSSHRRPSSSGRSTSSSHHHNHSHHSSSSYHHQQQHTQQQQQQLGHGSHHTQPPAPGGSTATTMTTDYRSVTSIPTPVPSYVHGSHISSAASASRFSDDETSSWISGVESHNTPIAHNNAGYGVVVGGGPRSVASSTCSSQVSRRGGGNNNNKSSSNASSSKNNKTNPYLRDGKTIKRVIDDLVQASDIESILTALSIACVEFDHDDTIKHNAELYYGAVAVLCEKLTMMDDHQALRMICAAIEMTFRGGVKYVKEAFHVNAPTLMPPLLRLLDRCEQSKVRFADEIILNITKTFHYLSRIPELRVSLTRQPGLLDSLQRVATSPLNVPSRNARVRVMANLANCDENKVLMYAHRGLLNSLLKIARLDPVDATREYATIALMDLASAPANQVPLAKNGQVLKVLTEMVVSEKITSIRESATTTIQNLAFPKSNRLRLVEFQNGLVLEALLSVLQKDTNEKTRRRAGGALTNLACDETAERMATHPGLLSTLAQVSVQKDKTTTETDVQSRACLALTKIASNINMKSKLYDELMDALIVASDTPVDNNISAVFRLRAREPECRKGMARHPGLLDKLAAMCVKPSWKDRENAIRAIMHLANENENRRIMCSSAILEGLIFGASSMEPPQLVLHPDNDPKQSLKDIQDSAIRAIARLATEFSNRECMAKHKGLLVAIAKATERESKLEMKGADAEQQKTFLGKPLLMSLLMAM